ncbi:hypothetical protein HZH68_017122 [Vespula germanica]|uniref:Odorant receptor n=1 Tax=Vespula germanica TaxID=30212 RepID=A0A834MMS8_VESGE|nr:hypothetical protein HZH68_017122 [Vespula germanica]
MCQYKIIDNWLIYSLQLWFLLTNVMKIDDSISGLESSNPTLFENDTQMNRKSLAQLLLEIENSLIDDDYNTSEKKFILIKYTKLAKYYFLTAFISMTLAIGLYFIVGILPNIKIAIRNSSLGYTLPYKTRVIINIDDTKVYFCVCLYQMLMVPIIIIGYVGFDCLFTHLAFHISAQFGILSCRVKEILDDCNSFQFNMKALIFRHYKLIRQAETLEDNFSVMILQQLMGTTFHLCISGYYALIGSVKQEGLTLTLFIAYAFSVLSTLFIYCYIGECLIQEVIEI